MIIRLFVLNQQINVHMTFNNTKDRYGINHRYTHIDSASECEMCLPLSYWTRTLCRPV